MAGKVVELVTEKICPIIENMGYEVVEVEYAKKNDGMNLTFYIDSANGVNIDDCEKVHKAIDAPLDELNPTLDASYILSVSSCGLDRPLKTDKDLQRNLGKKVEIKLYAPINKQKVFVGNLLSYNEKEVQIEAEGTKISLERSKIANIALSLDF